MPNPTRVVYDSGAVAPGHATKILAALTKEHDGHKGHKVTKHDYRDGSRRWSRVVVEVPA